MSITIEQDDHSKMISAFERQDVEQVCKIIQEHFGLSYDKFETSIYHSRLYKKSEASLVVAGNLYTWQYDNGFRSLTNKPDPDDDNDTVRCVLLIKHV
jgi:hypothetical protein